MFELFRAVVNRLGGQYKRRLLLLSFGAIIAGLLEVAGLALIFPLIAVVSDPSMVESNKYLLMVYEFMGFDSPEHMLYFIAISIGAVFILKNLYMIAFQYAQLSFIRMWRNDLAETVMKRYLKAPYQYHLSRQTNDMINMLNYSAYFVLNNFVLPCITFMSTIVVSSILLLFILVQFFWASLMSGVFMVLVSFVQSQVIKRMASKINQEANKPRAFNLSVLTQSIGAIKETKSYNREEHFERLFAHSNGRVSLFDRKMGFIQQVPPYITEITLITSIILMCCLVLSKTYSPLDGVISLAILAAVAFRLAPMINRALFSYSQLRVSSGVAQELLDEMDALDVLNQETPNESTTPLPFERELKLEHVEFYYHKNAVALHDINLSIKKGEFVGIIGASGAGKTTLVDLLLGLLIPEKGVYKVDDMVIQAEHLHALRRLMGYVSQSPFIFNATVRENVAFGVAPEDINDEKVSQALAMAQIDDFFRSQPDYTQKQITDGGKGLSGGQRQRLAIARALYHDPQVLILDEATSALDVETEYEITQVINRLKGDKTIIAIAHRLSTLKECDRVIYMEEGLIRDVGTFKELSAKHTSFARLLELSSTME